MKNIIIFGHKGMLGQMLSRYFNSVGYNVITTEIRFTKSNLSALENFLLQNSEAIIINAIGLIKQKSMDAKELYWANAILPYEISKIIDPSQLLIQPSTDCVFSGKVGSYTKKSISDANDDYGRSKFFGEKLLENRKNTIIFRVSIIGTDSNPDGKGLLNWFLSTPDNSELSGFKNHYWNGITTLEWAKVIHSTIENRNWENKCLLFQGGTFQTYSKYEMLKIFAKIFNRQININSTYAPEQIDRSLIPDVLSKNLEEQLWELVKFNL